MFTGLIEATGTVLAVTSPATPRGPTRLRIAAPGLAHRLHRGDSVAVSGVCLTALEITTAEFSADLAEETVQRTTLAGLVPGAMVNLELPTPAGAPLGGHVVQGHVDGVGTVLGLEAIDVAAPETSDWRLRFQLPAALRQYVVSQGSITVEGISLTVANVTGDVVSIAVIPHTYGATTIRGLVPGTKVNLEADVIAKYAEARATSTAWVLTEDYLLANGY